MVKSKAVKKQYLKSLQHSNPYFALKSQNEIYYQMASVFKAATNNEDKLTQKMVNHFLSGQSSEIFLENLL